jgi:LytS/YehU family sensor histidine kinase
MIFILLFIILLIFFLELKQIKRKKDQELIALKALKNEEELKMLQAKINPHFLYNALNSIASLADDNSEKAKTMILDLADMFSYSINISNSHFNKVVDSVNLVNIYLKIEQTRYGDRLEYKCFIEDEAKNYLVPRFLIQPLIENAVKHGISRIKKGIIKLRVIKRKNRLNISVLDNGPEFPQKFVEGYGSRNIKHKLELLYKGKYEIKYLNKPEKMVRVTIIDPFIEEPKKFIN